MYYYYKCIHVDMNNIEKILFDNRPKVYDQSKF